MKKLYTKLSLAACFSLVATLSGFAQQNAGCDYVRAHNQLLLEHPEIAEQEFRADKLTIRQLAQNRFKSNVDTVYTDTLVIPVVFHIVHQWGMEEISNAQIQNQVDILNRDFNFWNADSVQVTAEFKPVARGSAIKFRLATIDPNGNCTTGITRTQSLETTSGDDGAKLVPWDRKKYLNVWVVKKMQGGTAGYAYKPGGVDNPFNKVDGILILNTYIGAIGTADVGSSRALTHEVGHWLNLDHTWGGTNDPEVGCGDDGVGDTPFTKGHASCGKPKDAVCDTAGVQTYIFNGVRTNSGVVDSSEYYENRGANISRWTAVGVSSNSARDSVFAFSNWPTGAADGTLTFDTLQTVDASKYYEISFTPKFGNKLTMTGIKLRLSRNATGARAFAIRTSADNFSKNIPLTKQLANSPVDTVKGNIMFFKKDTAGSFDIASIALAGINQRVTPITFRIYALFAEDNSGTFGLDTVIFQGGGPVLIENVNNYMEYSYCPSVMYTAGQVERMRAALLSTTAERNNLVTAENRAATGTDGIHDSYCPPLADFYNDTIVCKGFPVRFNDYTDRAFVTSYEWTFQDASPATSTAENPTVTFQSAGWKTVTLKATGTYGSDTKTKTKAIYVSDASVALSVPYGETFASADVLNDKWFVVNAENNQTSWAQKNNIGYYDMNCVKLNASQSTGGKSLVDGVGDLDYMITPAFNMAGIANDYRVSFKLSAAVKTTSGTYMTDSLKVEYSDDCGNRWLLLKNIKKTELYTAGYVAQDYTPANKLQWKQIDIPVTAAIMKDNMRFRFTYTSATASNNIYIDDFFIGPASQVSIDEVQLDQSNFVVAPNPITNESNLKFFLTAKAQVDLTLTDITGKVVGTLNSGVMNEGEQSIGLSPMTGNLSNGIYMLVVKVGKQMVTHKLVVG